MRYKQVWKLVLAVIFFNNMTNAFAEDKEDKIEDPCGGNTALLNMINRPTVANSACVVPFKKAVLEGGY
jgi:hypothetical protein